MSLKKLPALKEADIEREILDFIYLKLKLFCFKIPKAGYFDAKQKRFRKHASPYAINGIADIAVIYRGLYLAIEVKSKLGVQSPAQLEFQRRVGEAGGHYYLVRSVEEAIKAIESVDALLQSYAPSE